MSLYLRPDEHLQWFRGGQLIMSSKRHTIIYSSGNGVGQFGGSEVGSSRVSTLVISEPQLSDSGNYTCAIRDTEHSQDIELMVFKGTGRLSCQLPSLYGLLIPSSGNLSLLYSIFAQEYHMVMIILGACYCTYMLMLVRSEVFRLTISWVPVLCGRVDALLVATVRHNYLCPQNIFPA